MMSEIPIVYEEGGRADLRIGPSVLSVRGRCGATPEEMKDLLFLRQVHGSTVLASPSGGESADGMVVPSGEMTPALRVADCLPVFLVSNEAVAAFHAGWRGLASGIASNTMDLFPGQPKAVIIGPSICPECYEVGEEVRDAVLTGVPTCGHPPGHLDLRLAAVQRLRLGGLSDVCPIYRLPGCTRCTEGMFHSYRADGTSHRNILWMRRFDGDGEVALCDGGASYSMPEILPLV